MPPICPAAGPAQARVQSRCTTRRRAIRIALLATLMWWLRR